MPALNSFDYAIVRIVPRVERGEFVNAGVILFCRSRRYLDARFDLDIARLQAIAPNFDPAPLYEHFEIISLVCAGGKDAGYIGQLTLPERFHWLVAPRSTIVQASPAHSGLCADPQQALERILDTMVRPLKL